MGLLVSSGSSLHMRVRSSSSTSGFLFSLCLSGVTFIAIHALFIIAHEYVNEATPQNTIAYLLDRSLEPGERLLGRARGDTAHIDVLVHLAEERIEEFEHLVVHTQESEADHSLETALLSDASDTLQRAIRALEDTSGEDQEDLETFTVALVVESTADDLARRLRFMGDQMREPEKQLVLDAAATMESIFQASLAITQEFTVEDTVAENLRRELAARRAPPPPEPPTEKSCLQKNDTCSTHRDCCGNLGLECLPVTLSDGSQSKRCLVSTVLVCDIECQEDMWLQPRRCTLDIAPPGTPDCQSLEQNACRMHANATRNIRKCVKE